MKQYSSNIAAISAVGSPNLTVSHSPANAPSGKVSLAGIDILSAEEGLIHQFTDQDHLPAPSFHPIEQNAPCAQDHFRAGLRLGSDALILRDAKTGQQLSISNQSGSSAVTFLQSANPALSLLRNHITKSLMTMPTAHCTGIARGTSIKTPQGDIPIEQLHPGQRVLTQNAETRVILGIARCEMSRLTQICLPQFAPVYFPPSSVGAQHETCLAPDQSVCISGPSVYYEFGEQEVYLRAKEFTSQARSYQQNSPVDLTYFHVILDQPGVMRTEAHWVDSLTTSDVSPDWFADMCAAGQLKTVASMPIEMLQHPAPTRRHLHRFEAQTLLAEMSRNF